MKNFIVMWCGILIATVSVAQTDSTKRKMNIPDTPYDTSVVPDNRQMRDTMPRQDQDNMMEPKPDIQRDDKTGKEPQRDLNKSDDKVPPRHEDAQIVTPEDSKSMNSQNMQKRDGVMMKEGKMYVIKEGQSLLMTREVTLSNGAKVMPEGYIVNKNGSRIMIKDGDFVDMEGSKTSNDGAERAVPATPAAPPDKTGTNVKPPPPATPATPSNKSKDAERNKPAKDKNMYLVPDSTLNKKQPR